VFETFSQVVSIPDQRHMQIPVQGFWTPGFGVVVVVSDASP
jgi:hypothetical protein